MEEKPKKLGDSGQPGQGTHLRLHGDKSERGGWGGREPLDQTEEGPQKLPCGFQHPKGGPEGPKYGTTKIYVTSEKIPLNEVVKKIDEQSKSCFVRN